jgi:hypothetical protein
MTLFIQRAEYRDTQLSITSSTSVAARKAGPKPS